jgi:hypothetical protein
MPFDRFRRVPPLSTLTPRAQSSREPSRNDLLATRERLATEERKAAAHLDEVRAALDDLGNQLHGDGGFVQAPVADPERLAAQIVEAGRKARAEVPPPLPPKGSVARLIVIAGMKARNEKVPPDD